MTDSEKLQQVLPKLEKLNAVIQEFSTKYSSFLMMVPGKVKDAVADLQKAIDLLKA